jgi:acyl-CoA dehydrogenase
MSERKAFRKPTTELQALQFMVADTGMRIEAARTMAFERAQSPTPATAPGALRTPGAMVTVRLASDTATQVTTDAVQIFGGYGFVKDLPGRALHARSDHQDYKGLTRSGASSSQGGIG